MSATTWNLWAEHWSALVLAVVWQSTVLAVAVAAVAWLLRRSTPSVRYWLWQIVAIKMLLAPLWTIVVPLPWLPDSSAARPAAPRASQQIADAPETATAPVGPKIIFPAPAPAPASSPPGDDLSIASASPDAAATVGLSWQGWLLVAWVALVVIQIVILARQRMRLAQLLASTASAPAEIADLVNHCAQRMGLRRAPRVLVTAADCSPFVCGLWRPALVLPQSLDALLSATQIEPVVVHELAHLRRRDLLWSWIPQIARMLYFFHPVAHWVAFRVRLEAELACDGWAMSTTGQGAGAYADLLVRVVSRLSEPAMLRTGSAASAGLDGQSPLSAEEK